MSTKQKTFTTSIIVFFAWMIINFSGIMIQTGGSTSLNELVEQQIAVSFILAVILLFAVILYYKWQAPTGLQASKSWRTWLLAWLPLTIIALFFLMGISRGLPPARIISFIMFNTMLVGISEELMFRGILFNGALVKYRVWPAIWITSIMFGAIHALNGFITGDFVSAIAQSIQAALFGVWLVAIRIRTGSIYLAIIIHWLWDFSVFTSTWGAAAETAEEPSLLIKILVPILLELFPFLYGLWLLKGVGKQKKEDILNLQNDQKNQYLK